MPKRALVVVAPHGALLMSGRKKVLVKSKRYRLEGEELLVIESKRALGTVVAGPPVTINLRQFRAAHAKHLVSEAERRRWWAGHDTLYMYPVVSVRAFARPRLVEYPNGAQVFVRCENVTARK